MDTIYYDGDCGLCHRWVKFVLPRDPGGERFVFSPLGSDFFNEHVAEAEREKLPDSIVLQTADGRLLTRSAAVLAIFKRLGGRYRVFAAVMGIVPRFLRDFVYGRVAAVRKRLFAKPADACPMMPPDQRARFRF